VADNLIYSKYRPKPLLCVANESGYKGLDNTIAQLKEEQKRSKNNISFRELSNEELAKEFPQATFSKTYRGCIEYSAGILLADRCLATVQVTLYFNYLEKCKYQSTTKKCTKIGRVHPIFANLSPSAQLEPI
jgi:hypothetical protein